MNQQPSHSDTYLMLRGFVRGLFTGICLCIGIALTYGIGNILTGVR